jgi:hypothetical protein
MWSKVKAECRELLYFIARKKVELNQIVLKAKMNVYSNNCKQIRL